MGQTGSTGFCYMVDHSLGVNHPRRKRPTGNTQVRFRVDLPIEPMECHFGNAISEGALLRVVCHGSAEMEDPAMASN